MSNILPVEKVIAIIKLVQPVTVNPKTKYLKIMVISETKDIAEKINPSVIPSLSGLFEYEKIISTYF